MEFKGAQKGPVKGPLKKFRAPFGLLARFGVDIERWNSKVPKRVLYRDSIMVL